MVSKRNKIYITILLTCAALLFGFYLVTGLFPQAEEVVLPSGGLTASIFDSQNMTYKKVEEYPNTLPLDGLPY